MFIKLTVISANNLFQKSMFKLPDPFVVITIDGSQTHTTLPVKKTLNPYYNQTYNLEIQENSILSIQVFDQKKFKSKDQGFMGTCNIPVRIFQGQVLKLELKRSNADTTVCGTVDVRIERGDGTLTAQNRSSSMLMPTSSVQNTPGSSVGSSGYM
jgi:E3 ubiquitin-protein ligase NEDD4